MKVVREVTKEDPYHTEHDELAERGARLGQKELDKITKLKTPEQNYLLQPKEPE